MSSAQIIHRPGDRSSSHPKCGVVFVAFSLWRAIIAKIETSVATRPAERQEENDAYHEWARDALSYVIIRLDIIFHALRFSDGTHRYSAWSPGVTKYNDTRNLRIPSMNEEEGLARTRCRTLNIAADML